MFLRIFGMGFWVLEKKWYIFRTKRYRYRRGERERERGEIMRRKGKNEKVRPSERNIEEG